MQFDDTPMYVHEDAVKFIKKRLGLSEYIIEKVLEAELDYMRSLGLVVDLEEEND